MLEPDQDEYLVHCPSEFLAIVDLESYRTFVGKDADHLDMMAHLHTQMKALTAVAWGAPQRALNFRIRVTEDDRVVDHAG